MKILPQAILKSHDIQSRLVAWAKNAHRSCLPLVLLLFVFLVGCSGAIVNAGLDKIYFVFVGRWDNGQDGGGRRTFFFRPDGTFQERTESGSGFLNDDTGKYYMENRTTLSLCFDKNPITCHHTPIRFEGDTLKLGDDSFTRNTD